MNFQPQFQNQLDSMNFNFQNMNLQGSNGVPPLPSQQHVPNMIPDHNISRTSTPNPNNGGGTPSQLNRAPLSRTTSLLDSIGIQRVGSPFMQPGGPSAVDMGGGLSQNMQSSSILNNWGTPLNNNNNNSNGGVQLNHEDSSLTSSPYAAKMHPSLSTQSLMFSRSSAGTPVLNHSTINSGLATTNNAMYAPMTPSDSMHFQQRQIQPQPHHTPILPHPPPQQQQNIPILIESQWKYIDSMGQVQGPFESSKMNSWLASGYFPSNLQVSRTNTSPEPLGINDKFMTVTEIINFSNDFFAPFSAVDKIISASILSQQASTLAGGSTSLQDSLSSLSTGLNSAKPNLREKDYSYDELLQLRNNDGSYYKESIIKIPVGRSKKEKLDPDFVVPQAAPEPLLPKSPTPVKHQSHSPKKMEISKTADIHSISPKKTSPLKTETSVATKDEREVHHTEEKVLKVEQGLEEDDSVETEETQDEESEKEEEEEEISEVNDSKLATPSQGKTNLAPWANKVEKVEPVNIPSLEEMKKQTLSKKQLDQNNLAQMRLEQAQLAREEVIETQIPTRPSSNVAPWANKVTSNKIEPVIIPAPEQMKKKPSSSNKLEKITKATPIKWEDLAYPDEKKDNEMKSMLTWATKPTSVPVSLNIKPQPKKKSSSTVSSGSTSTSHSSRLGDESVPSLLDLNDNDFITEQKKLWQDAHRSSGSSSTDNAWTTVSSKSSKSSVTTTQAKIVSQPSSYVSPDKLRSIGGSSTPVRSKQIGSSTTIPSLKAKASSGSLATAYPGNASISARQELIKWSRSQMKLDSGIQVNSVLEVLFSLPAGTESTEIIADTIYSNSSTMDGKRFATEFIKRRIDCERQLTDPLTWIEALALPEGNEDDWEFQVVGKKKSRRH
ncbi:hypothetical protein Kpol_1048p36 [Vanderwaltozyma polyspora DSM 70294]|uniref:GYF domain-containing protein n=1 Tax=Vanderwaltozyma polyspora (strain ATCC 22028 / DSM 70294 / BCRC 21397 / CBS 2163 / NBRC 10782 / NRRL Y-8283 / UCD 57-17) TaxID=436907 RepID=A7TGJ8_VANPO|nr:uncharacterized protein Kpol_1048p36 [Vanderwaltozyma polyspora DSM 70294]EDO18605.1 hypothetical protein Kpol_1048p36 [Vanderwaltozyma polyspora DSM 70294]